MPIYHFNYTTKTDTYDDMHMHKHTILVPEKTPNSYTSALHRAKNHISKTKKFTGNIEDYDISIAWIE